MIPKIIHYCWMSGEEFPPLIKECIESWKTILPDYEVKEWNSQNFDVNMTIFTSEAMSKKKYAFVSDYVRLYALYHYGGIYLDSDIKVLKSFNDLLENRAFTGFEDKKRLGVWLLASESKNPLFRDLLDVYKDKHFIDDEGNMDLTPNPIVLGPIFEKYGIKMNNSLQKNEHITVYPTDYFCPLDYNTGKVNITSNSYAIHLFNGAWKSGEGKKYIEYYRKYYQKYERFLPNGVASIFAKLYVTCSLQGISGIINKMYKYL